MKRNVFISFATSILLFSVLMLLGSCGTSNKSLTKKDVVSENDAEAVIVADDTDNSPQNWGNLFRRVPGVRVSGEYPDITIILRGQKSITQNNEPLYLLDGVPLGHDFENLARTVNPQDVATIRVVTGPQTAIYGARGRNGVIDVRLKE